MPKFKKNPSPFRMGGYSYPGISPMKQDTEKIQRNFEKKAANSKRTKKNQLYELGYFQDTDGKVMHPFGKGSEMNKAKWNEWKSKDENKPYKGKTKN